MGSAGRDYAFGGFLMILATLAMVFLDGSLAVFVAIAAAVSGMVLFVRGAQIEHFNEDPLAPDEYGIPGPRGEGFNSGFDSAGLPSLKNYDSAPGSDFAPGLDSGFDWDAHYRREFGEGPGSSGGAGGAGGSGGPGGPGGPDGSTRL